MARAGLTARLGTCDALDVLLVSRFDALGTGVEQYLPPAADLLACHLYVGVVMTPSPVVEGGVEFDVHVSAFVGVAEWVGLTVDRTATFDLPGASEGGYAA